MPTVEDLMLSLNAGYPTDHHPLDGLLTSASLDGVNKVVLPCLRCQSFTGVLSLKDLRKIRKVLESRVELGAPRLKTLRFENSQLGNAVLAEYTNVAGISHAQLREVESLVDELVVN
jgi:hypothetical protein